MNSNVEVCMEKGRQLDNSALVEYLDYPNDDVPENVSYNVHLKIHALCFRQIEPSSEKT